MAKVYRKNMTEKQLANLKGVQNRKPKSAVEEPKEVFTDDEKRRKDDEANEEIIFSTYTELLMQKQKVPSYAAIAAKTKLSEKTVMRHLENYNYDEIRKKFRAGSQAIYMNLFKNAATSKDVKWSELWFKLEGLLNNKVDITSNGETLQMQAPQIIIGNVPQEFPSNENEVDAGK